ncbi:MAG: biopolymer transporter ExbD [Candidatus Margulisiibacteriota bacterium]
MNFSRKKKYLRGLEHTAMTDIVFILLIFFLLTSSFVVQTGIKVDLPQAKEMAPLIKQDIVVTVAKNGGLILVNEEKVNRAALYEVLQKKLAYNLDKLVIFKADKEVQLGKLVDMMDTAKRAGAEKVAIATREG